MSINPRRRRCVAPPRSPQGLILGRPRAVYDRHARIVALTIPDREALLRVLEDCPDELAELRGVLLREHRWRTEHGL